MARTNESNSQIIENIFEQLRSFDKRISNIENQLNEQNINAKSNVEFETTLEKEATIEDSHSQTDGMVLESKIGEYGLALLGSIVLLFGITFAMKYIENLGQPIISTAVGYAVVACVFILGSYLKNSFTHLSFMFKICGHLLVYYVTLKLFFFTPDPLIPNKGIVLFLVLLAIGIQIFIAIRQKSAFLAGLGIILSLLTALFSDGTHITLPLITAATILSLFLFIRFAWWRLLLFSIGLIYLTFIFWFLNNPIMGHPLKIVATHQFSIIYVFTFATIISLSTFVKQKGLFPDKVYIAIVLLNGISFLAVVTLIIMAFFPEDYAAIFAVIFVFCIFFSVVLKIKTERQFSSAFYACCGFMALSISIYGYADLPNAYWMLAIQSLLVISFALWFKSKIITIVNTLLFLTIFLAYITTAHAIGLISLVIALVALITARILNWKKERLSLQTELLRNVYLIAAFIGVLYGLYHAIPGPYVTLSWTAAAAIYFILSIILHNVKYRWMAIFTFIVTGFYLFIVDLSHLDMGYRVIAFLFLAIISIGTSVYYTKRIMNKNKP